MAFVLVTKWGKEGQLKTPKENESEVVAKALCKKLTRQAGKVKDRKEDGQRDTLSSSNNRVAMAIRGLGDKGVVKVENQHTSSQTMWKEKFVSFSTATVAKSDYTGESGWSNSNIKVDDNAATKVQITITGTVSVKKKKETGGSEEEQEDDVTASWNTHKSQKDQDADGKPKQGPDGKTPTLKDKLTGALSMALGGESDMMIASVEVESVTTSSATIKLNVKPAGVLQVEVNQAVAANEC